MRAVLGAGLALAMASAAAACAQETAAPDRVDVAQFDDEGRLIYPDDIETWVHVGSSVGLNYGPGQAFSSADAQIMNVVTMEPTAYRRFMESGAFPEGTMFHLTFHQTVRDDRLDSAGFATGPAVSSEIHLKDSARFEPGFNFFTFGPGQSSADAVPLPNDCVTCHTANGEHDGTFVQFYPAILARLGEAEER